MPLRPDPRIIDRRPFLAPFQKGNRFPKWPERPRKELERLRITTPKIRATPTRWLRIAPAQYLKERGDAIVIMYSTSLKAPLSVRVVLTAGQSSVKGQWGNPGLLNDRLAPEWGLTITHHVPRDHRHEAGLSHTDVRKETL